MPSEAPFLKSTVFTSNKLADVFCPCFGNKCKWHSPKYFVNAQLKAAYLIDTLDNWGGKEMTWPFSKNLFKSSVCL